MPAVHSRSRKRRRAHRPRVRAERVILVSLRADRHAHPQSLARIVGQHGLVIAVVVAVTDAIAVNALLDPLGIASLAAFARLRARRMAVVPLAAPLHAGLMAEGAADHRTAHRPDPALMAVTELVSDHRADQTAENHPSSRRPLTAALAVPGTIAGWVIAGVARFLKAFALGHGNAHLADLRFNMGDARVVVVRRGARALGVIGPALVRAGQVRRSHCQAECNREHHGSAEQTPLLLTLGRRAHGGRGYESAAEPPLNCLRRAENPCKSTLLAILGLGPPPPQFPLPRR